MISKLGIKIVSILVIVGNFCGVTRFTWDRKRNRVVQSKSVWNLIAYSITIGNMLFIIPVIYRDYAVYLDKHGFDLGDDMNIFKYFYCGVGGLLILLLWCCHLKRGELAILINQTIEYVSSIPERHNIKSPKKYNIMVPLYIIIMAAGSTMPAIIGLICTLRCKMHPYHDTFPIICHLGGPDSSILLKIAIKVVAFLLILNLGTYVFASALLTVYPAAVLLFYGLEISQTLEVLDYTDPKRRRDFIQIYKCLEILKYRANEFNGAVLLPGLFAQIQALYLVSFNAILKGQLGPITTLGLVDVVIIFIIYFSVFQFCWKVVDYLSGSRTKCVLLGKSLADRMVLLGTSEIFLEFGNFGPINRELFGFLANLIVDNTISVLLM